MVLKKVVFATMFFSCSAMSHGQGLSHQESRIVKQIDDNTENSISFLEKTVDINSGTYNIKGVQKVGKVYQDFLNEIGFTTRWISLPDSLNRGGHLVAEWHGKSKGKRILLLGHMDTVFEPDSTKSGEGGWKLLSDSLAMGPGTYDMKGGNMIMLYALKALKETAVLKNMDITVVLHGDEEEPGRPISISRKDIVELAQSCDVALCFENSTGFNDATIARRGFQGWSVTVSGKQAHSSSIFTENVGAGAIYEQARILNRFYNELQEPNLTFSPGIVGGGTAMVVDATQTNVTANGKSNLVASKAFFSGDLRYLSEQQRLSAVNKMKAIVASSLPNTHAEIIFRDASPAMAPTEGNKKILQVLSQISLDLGQGEVSAFDPAKRGAGDLSYIAQYLDCLDGLGALGYGAHAPEEYVELKPFNSLEKRAALLIYRLANMPR